MADELLEITEKQTMSREAAAERLRTLADQLSRHNQVEFVRNGVTSRQRFRPRSS